MATPLRVLLIEDNPSDAELVLYELRRVGFELDSRRAETEADFLAALDPALDLILADYSLPQFTGLRALELLVERGLDIPFILISGTIGEEVAVTAIKRGATDYLLKDRLGRLGVAVEQALKNRAAKQERRAAATALRESDERLRIALRNSPIVVFNQDRDLRYTWIHNLRPGFGLQEVLGKSDAERFSPPEADRLTEIKRRVLETGVALREEVTLTIHGQTLTYDLSVEPQRDAHANIIGVTGVSVDITERKEGKIELVRLRKAVEASGEVIFLTDRTGLITFVNPEFTYQYGYTAEEVVGKVTPRILKGGMMKTETYSLFWQTLLNKQTIQLDMINKTKDGRLLTMEVSVNPVLDELGEIDGFLAVQRNITDRKQAEAEHEQLATRIQAQAKQMEQVLATVPAGVLMLDSKGRILQANPVAQADLALLAGAAVGEIITHLGDHALGDLLTSPPTKGLWHEIQTDHRIFEAMIRPVETGSMTEHWVLVLNEITRTREIQTQLQQQERLASVGQLAAGIAHDFNNIMAVIVLYAQMVARSKEIGDRNREKMETINQQAWHASRLIQQLLDFSRRSVLQRQSMDLLPLLKEQVKLLERTLSEDVVLRLDYGQGEYTINADPTRIQQMITNLAINARDAMPAGGTLHMDLSRIEIQAIDGAQPPVPGAAVGVEAGEWIKLILKDTGMGIPPHILPHIFDPFFTTKQVGSGTGLGLAQVHGIVGQHGGYIAVKSTVGQGTTFTIHLPALPPSPQEPARIVDISAIPQGHGELLLVVEDQKFVRDAVVATLETFGYQTIEAKNGKEALEIMQRQGDEVALILSDVVMPVMGGIVFFHTLREQAWTTPFIMLTGHPLDEEFKTLHKEGLNAWLSKPPDLEELAQAIAQALQDAKS